MYHLNLKDIHKEKSPSNRIPALTKNINIEIWVVDASKQFFITGS